MPKRKTKLTDELSERICRYLRLGTYVETAAACVGIHKDTFYDWLKRGGKGVEPYAEFVKAVERAMAESEARDLGIIGKAAETQWQAAAWRLERRFPEKYGRRDATKIDATVDVDVRAKGSLGAKLAKLLGDAGEAAAVKSDDVS